MKLGLLETGRPPRGLIPRFGDYPAMFRHLLGPDAYDYSTYDVAGGVLPARPEACDAYLVTGSPAGVYDDLPWIAPLRDFLVQAKGKAALVGICFGHQAMAEAFGGRVIKSPKGWGVGLHAYQVRAHEPWMDGSDVIHVSASHQDQVVELPPGAEVAAGNDFSPMGMLIYRDQPAVSLQLHPEFAADYSRALITSRSGGRVPKALADAALRSLDAPDDNVRLGGWIRRFLAQAQADR